LLTAITIIPLVVLPESNFVDISSTPKTTILRILGIFEAGVLLARVVTSLLSEGRQPAFLSTLNLGKSRPSLAILGAIATVTVVSVISTILSILPHQSWWGRNPAGFEAGKSQH
jgi:hypothetical protein